MSAPFTGSEFFLETVAQYALATVRVRFTQDPLVANPAGANAGSNPANYILTGPTANAILSVVPVFGDPQAVDLFLQQALTPGTWTVTVKSNVQMWDATSILVPRSMSFTATALIMPEAVDGGAVTDTSADLLRKHLNIALVGSGWDAIIAAMATGDDANVKLARSAFDQLFKTSASGLYLERKSGDDGLIRPSNLGMPDDLFREYSIRVTTGKLVENALLDILEVFYGSDGVRAHADSVMTEPYSFQDGDDLVLLIDEKTTVNVVFAGADFAVPGAARAVEVAAAITRACRVAGVSAYVVAVTDPTTGSVGVRIYSGALGLASAIRVLGGKAQFGLRFPSYLAIFSGLPTWTITYAAATGILRFASSALVDLSQLRVGDYVTVYGTEFNAANRGTYSVTNVYYAYSPGLVQYFEVANVAGVAEGVVQAATSSLAFFRPTKQATFTDPTRAVIVAVPGAEVDVVMPATSQAVGRGPKSGAYLQSPSTATATSISRLGNVVTVAAVAHGLGVGDSFILDGAYSTYAPPATVPGTPPNLDASLVSIPAVTDGDPFIRNNHQTVKLVDGRVLLVAGFEQSGPSTIDDCRLVTFAGPTILGSGARRYSATWSAATVIPGGVRQGHQASVLVDALRVGQVFVSGGDDGAATTYNTTKLYVPNGGAGTWAAGPNMSQSRTHHNQVVLNNGKVLIVGGANVAGTVNNTSDLYDPATNLLAATGTLLDRVSLSTLVKLADGRVLRVGGFGQVAATGSNRYLWTCEIYTPGTGLWTVTGSMTYARSGHDAVLLSDGRVLVAGGFGHVAARGGADTALNTCEIWDPVTGRWSPGPTMNSYRSSPTLVAVGTRVYAVGSGAVDLVFSSLVDTLEYLDLSVMNWRQSTASMPISYASAKTVAVNSELIFLTGGMPADGNPVTEDHFFVLASETVGASNINVVHEVATAPDADHLTFLTDDSGYFMATSGTLTSTKAVASLLGSPGPYSYDPLNGVGVTGSESATSTQFNQGHQYAFVDVADATVFPDAPGWLVMGYGYEYQVGPVKYLGRLSSTRLALDYSFKFTATVPAGSQVTLLVQKGPWVPAHPESVGSFYGTGSAAGRVAAEAAVDAAVAAGVVVKKTITYPGDRGLGGEGLPAAGVPRISDKVEVWAGDEVDAEVAAARKD